MKPTYFLYLLLFIVPCFICNAQPFYFKHYQVENGLSNNTVYCSLQDKRGFLWLGTKDGLNRFDGYTFKVFRHDPKDPKSISNNMVHTLSLDAKGNLWIGTDKGIDKYDFSSEGFTHLRINKQDVIRSIAHDKLNNTWFIFGSSLFKYNVFDGKLTDYGSLQSFEATSLLYHKGVFWLSTTAGTLEKFNESKRSFESYNLFKNSKWVASNAIEKIYPAGNDKLLVGTTNQGVKAFDIATGTYKDLLTYNEDHTEIFVRDFLKYNDHQIWIATESGIYIYNTENGSTIHLKKNYNDPYSLSDNAVYTLYKDTESGVWAGTYFGGLNYYSQQYSIFTKYYPGTDHENSLKGNVVREICKDTYGNLWLGTEDNGLNKLNPDKRTWTHFCPNGSSGLSNTNIHGLLPNGNELFVGTFERGLDVLNISSGKVERIYLAGKERNKLKSNFIIGFCKTKAGDIYTGTTKGMYKYQQTTKDFTPISAIPVNAFIYSMHEGHNRNIWLGTVNDGLYSYHIPTNQGAKIKFGPEAHVLETSTINGVFEDSNQKLWLATDGIGLWQYDPAIKHSKVYNLDNGFPSNHVYRILEDDNKNLWISTSHGLVCLNLTNGNQHIYTKSNGLLSDQFNYNSAYKDADGTLYFGCVKGMISFNPAAFKQRNLYYPVYITGFQVHNQEISVRGQNTLLQQSVLLTKEVNLNHNQSSFSIDFAALNFSAPEMIRYKYMMKGLDKNWIELKRNRKVYFTQLAPGHYTFIVKAINSKGQWNLAGTTLEINIAPPFWASVYAYFIYAVLAVVFVYFLLKRYHAKTRQKNERIIESLNHDKEKQIYTAKIEFFTNVAHEIRTPLTLIKGPMESIMKSTGQSPAIQNSLKVMETNTNRLLELTNQLLDFRKAEQDGYRLNFVKTNINQLLTDTFSQFRSLAEHKELAYKLKQPFESVYAYVDKEAFTKILYNLIGNAIKYSTTTVEVELLAQQPEKDTFNIEFRNDGDAVPFEMRDKIFEPFFRMKVSERHTGTGIGLPLSRSLAELHKGKLELNELKRDRNTFTLSIPIHQDHEFDFSSGISTSDQPEADNEGIVQDTNNPVVLVVDDNPEILEFISQELKTRYTVLKARNGQEAISKIESATVQLIISDVMMPVMDGFELCKKIKTDLAYSHIPIILLTAKNSLQSRIEGLDIGADAYLDKPFSPQHLHVQIANLLSNRSKIKEHFASSPLTPIRSMANSKADEKFLEKLGSIICNNMQNTELDAEYIANLMNMSKPTLYRKIKAISDLSLNELINITRLKAAAKLLEAGEHKVYEVAALVGYSSQSHLGRNFLKQFGTTPTEYQQSKGAKKVVSNS
ncbi:response regulator [Mucilaginibacter sp. Bleaf8]|uniref:two-component regulator propeller domain-containing protein n=1 Tax=Mucilaginibacter sp. Bleaf8 TaxID=2834430 RepID=UPI001BD08B8A|nr:two-component regulator propeller domain-containing protein [Mucilaginibacter sp. Bleaf8]MBS7562792.1 response regulator [Mucilaginibacter sp. Bleaf8]